VVNLIQQLSGLWKDAEPEIPILKDAEVEFAKLQAAARGSKQGLHIAHPALLLAQTGSP